MHPVTFRMLATMLFVAAMLTSTEIRAGEPAAVPVGADLRKASLDEHNTLFGGTGLLHTLAAGSGASGSFRV